MPSSTARLSSSGLTLADYLFVRTAGGEPIRRATGDDVVLRPGAVVVVVVDGGLYARSSLAALAANLSSRGLRPVPLRELLASEASTRATGAERARTSAPAAISASDATIGRSRAGDAGHHS